MPNLILKYSSRLSLSSNSMLILLACFHFQQQGKEELKVEDFACLLNVTEKSIKASFETMANHGLITVSGNTCDLSGLFEKITDFWAEEKLQTIGDSRPEAASTSLVTNPEEIRSPRPQELFQTFEQEFGRALSQMECAKILSWSKDKGCSESVILEALKRAVLRGVLNLTYIDRILAQWSKLNLRTDQEVKTYEEHFLSSRMTNKNKGQSDRETGSKDRESRIKDKEEKYKDIYLS